MCLQAPVECKLYSLLFLLHAGALFFLFSFFVCSLWLRRSHKTLREDTTTSSNKKKKKRQTGYYSIM